MILIVSAIALVVINANDTATALQTETTQPQTETTEPETEVPLPKFMEERLQDLVERGFVTQEQLDEMEGRFRDHGPWNGELPDGFDPEQLHESTDPGTVSSPRVSTLSTSWARTMER